MAKYSTGGASGGGDDGTCELCGAAADRLTTASVAGAELSLCPDCADLDESSSKRSSTDREPTNRQKRAAQNAARQFDAATGDSTHWEEDGTNYESDALPYLVAGYGQRVTRARQDAGYQLEELAAELGVSENDLLAVEQGRANKAGVGGSVVLALESHLDIELTQ